MSATVEQVRWQDTSGNWLGFSFANNDGTLQDKIDAALLKAEEITPDMSYSYIDIKDWDSLVAAFPLPIDFLLIQTMMAKMAAEGKVLIIITITLP